MKVSIVTEGFQNTGYGHITRCLSIAQAFEERNIFPTLYVNGDENSKPFLPSNNYKIIDWLQRPTLLISEIKNSDVLIMDSYLAGKEFYENLSKHSRISLFIDDNLRVEYPVGIILNGTVNADTFHYPNNRRNDYLLGSRYIPLRKDFWNVPSRKISQTLTSILITFGGQDIQNLTLPIIKALEENFPKVKKKIVIGSGFTQTIEIEKCKNDFVELFFSPGSSEMLKLMLSSDIAISASGQTLYELAVTGTPTIAIGIADNQKNNIAEWKKKGFLHDPIFYGDVNILRKIISQVEKFQSVSIRKKLSGIGRENVDGHGSRRVVEFIIDKICSKQNFYLRKATQSDSQKVFNLSNDPEVRMQSITREPIVWEDHAVWFSKKISDENYIFLLAFDKKDNFIGQVKFQIEKDFAVISISISDNYRGKGLSKKILNESCLSIFQEKNFLKKIIAYIRQNNTASIGGFKSAGFTFAEEKQLNGEAFLRFILERKN